MSFDPDKWRDGWQWRTSPAGRVVELWATPESIAAHAAGLEHEPIRSLWLQQASTGGLAGLSLRTPFRSLRALSVEATGVSGQLVSTLVQRLRSPRLRSLTLSQVRLDGSGREWRGVFAALPALENLDLSECFSSGEAAALFWSEACVPALRRLSLWANGLAGGVEAFARALRPVSRRLGELGLGGNGLDGRAVCTLLEGLRVERVWLTQNPLGPEGMRRIARTVDARGLRQIAVARCELGDAGARALTLWLKPSALDHVFAAGNEFGVASARAFATHWPKNVDGSLLLSENELGDDGVAALAGSSLGDRLRWLDLAENGLTVRAVQALIASPHLNRLRELDLSGNELLDEGVIALSHSPLLRRLVELDLVSNHITRVGARVLADHAGKRLRTLWLSHGNQIPEMLVRTMKSRGVGVA